MLFRRGETALEQQTPVGAERYSLGREIGDYLQRVELSERGYFEFFWRDFAIGAERNLVDSDAFCEVFAVEEKETLHRVHQIAVGLVQDLGQIEAEKLIRSFAT